MFRDRGKVAPHLVWWADLRYWCVLAHNGAIRPPFYHEMRILPSPLRGAMEGPLRGT